jgi:hypothetical protein
VETKEFSSPILFLSLLFSAQQLTQLLLSSFFFLSDAAGKTTLLYKLKLGEGKQKGLLEEL